MYHSWEIKSWQIHIEHVMYLIKITANWNRMIQAFGHLMVSFKYFCMHIVFNVALVELSYLQRMVKFEL